MKKYLAAAVVALMVFAFSAFAASLNVNAGTLQAGVDSDLTCGESADVTYVTSNDFNGHWVGGVSIQFDEECEGEYAQVALLANEPGWPNHQLVYAISSDPIDADGVADIDFNCDGDIYAEDVNTVQVLVKSLTPAEQAALPFASCNPLP